MRRAPAQIDLDHVRRTNPRAAAALEAQGVPAKAKARVKGSKDAGEEAEAALYASLTALGIAHEPQYLWGALLDPPRRFCADAAVPERRLLIEIDGGVHGLQEKRARDLIRQNLGTLAGWAFLRFLPEQAISGDAALMVERFLEGRA